MGCQNQADRRLLTYGTLALIFGGGVEIVNGVADANTPSLLPRALTQSSLLEKFTIHGIFDQLLGDHVDPFNPLLTAIV